MIFTIKGKSTCLEADGSEIVSVEIRLITPDIAKEILQNNPHNRNIKPNRLTEITNDMKNDRWKINGESIVINQKGELKDGQHRLLGIVNSGKTYPFVVVTIRESEGLMFDCGTIRTVHDQIRFSGDPDLCTINESKIAGATSFLLSLSNGKQKRISKSEIMDNMKQNLDVWLWLKETPYDTLKAKKGVGCSPVFAAIACAYKSGYPENKLIEFMNVMITGVTTKRQETPIIRLRDYLQTKIGSGGREAQNEVFMRCQHTLHAFEVENEKAICRISPTVYYPWEAKL